MSPRVDDLLRSRRKLLVEAWEAEVRRTLPPAEAGPRYALAELLPELLERLAEEVTRVRGGRAVPCGRPLERRVPEELPPSRVLDEFRILRRLVVSQLRDEPRRARGAAREAGAPCRADEAERLELALDAVLGEVLRGWIESHDRRLGSVQQRLRLALDSAAIGTWDLDVRSGTFTWDSRCREMFGLRHASEGAYERFLAAVHPEDRGRVDEAVRASLNREARGEYRAEYRIVRGEDRAVRWIDARGVAVFGERGEPVRFVGTVADVTEAKLADEMRDRFIAILGHDLRSPLGAISMAATYILRAGPLPAGVERSASVIARSAARMNRMIRDLLDLARRRVGATLPISPAAGDLGEICAQLVEEFRLNHPRRRIALMREGCLAGVWDCDRLAQAVSNLVGNAIAHGEDPIVVRARGAGEAVCVDVTNAGPPIPEQQRCHLFEPYRLGLRGARPGGSGLGLGLYIVSEIAAAHGGRVDVGSGEEGTTFTMRVPRRV